jgi:hypothetical protein
MSSVGTAEMKIATDPGVTDLMALPKAAGI